mmetsp:Transcript_21281/g.81235  ORF Transcript_21281/g.81235 Transcript_21281/m.81235 type:complete len:232 (+) Transcript_21281:2717-3412(+)
MLEKEKAKPPAVSSSRKAAGMPRVGPAAGESSSSKATSQARPAWSGERERPRPPADGASVARLIIAARAARSSSVDGKRASSTTVGGAPAELPAGPAAAEAPSGAAAKRMTAPFSATTASTGQVAMMVRAHDTGRPVHTTTSTFWRSRRVSRRAKTEAGRRPEEPVRVPSRSVTSTRRRLCWRALGAGASAASVASAGMSSSVRSPTPNGRSASLALVAEVTAAPRRAAIT